MCSLIFYVVLVILIYNIQKAQMRQDQEDEMIAFKLKSFEAEASQHIGSTLDDGMKWIVRFGFTNQLSNVPRINQFGSLLRIVQTNQNLYLNLFGNQDNVCQLFDYCTQLYDYAFLVEQFVRLKGETALNNQVIHKLQKKVMEIFDRNADSESLLYLQGLHMYITVSQSSSKEPVATFLGAIFNGQRKQAALVYRWVFKPLFEKKNLKPLYTKIVELVSWLIFMDADLELINDLSKKLNSFVLYHKSETSIEMISVCNRIFDLLSVHFPRESGLHHFGLASILVKLRANRIDYFLDMWLEARIAFINTINFEFLLRNLTQMGSGSLVLDVLGRLWAYMRRNSCFSVLLKIFSGFIRKEYLKLWLDRGEELSRYIKFAKYFMVGLCNRQRFEGEQIDEFTSNLCRHLIKRGTNFSMVYREIIQFYALYENRFSYLSQTSKRFMKEVQDRYNATIQIARIHALFDELAIRELTYEEEEEYWQKGKVSFRYRGLQNMGNTCYINSFMQCLYMTRKVRGFIHEITKDNALPSDKLKSYALHNLFQELSKKSLQQQGPFRPEYFRMELPSPFNTTFQQQDTGEFGRIYLQTIVKQLGPEHGKRLQKLLIQKLQKTIRCLRCHQQKSQKQKVFDLIVSINRQETSLYLSKLLQQYFSAEKFQGQNKVFCQKCQSKQEAVTDLSPDQFSQVVVVTLNLFDYVGEGRKILTPLMFEFSLNFDVLLNQKDLGQYELYAFIVHLGSHLGGGHYICYARNLEENPISWYCLDDGYVTERQIGKVEEFGFSENETPYMLFYSRKPALKHSKTIPPVG